MVNIQFKLNSGRKITDYSKSYPIYLRYTLGRKVDLNVSIGFKVLPDNWDEGKQRVKNRSSIENRDEINTLISNFIKHFETFENSNKVKGITPTYEDVRTYYDSYFTKPIKSKELFEFINEFIEKSKVSNNPLTGKRVSLGTIKGYKVTEKILIDFNHEVYKLRFDKITLEFYYDFVEYCNNRKLSQNYIGKHIKTIKTFMLNAVELGLTKNESFRSNKFKVLKEETDDIYLTIDELNRIWALDFKVDKRKEQVRDLFLIGAFTGLRVSDYNSISNSNITEVNGVKMLKIKTTKTGQVVAIPLHPIVLSILNKYNGNPPKSMPEQKINEKIKEICFDAEIDEVEFIAITKGGVKITSKKHRFELVKTHTARRSFCTNAYLLGMSSLDIMSISGHKTESAFMKYIKVTPEQVAIKMSVHPFFTNNSHLKIV